MDKQLATKYIEENHPTVAELRDMVVQTQRHGHSRVNPTLPKEDTLNLFLGALQDRDRDESIGRSHKDFLVARNIVRECL